jgi:hypothetical protein
MYPPDLLEQIRNNMVVESLSTLCRYLGTVRQGRKAVVYVSEGMTARLPVGVHTLGGAQGNIRQSPMQTAFASGDLMRELSKIFEAASRSNTSVYTLDPRGLGSEFGAEDRIDLESSRQVLAESTDILRTIASQTDGRAIINRNDPIPDLRQMLRDTGTYYLLGYTTSLPADGKFHSIDVKVKRPNVEVQHRKGYWAVTETELAAAAPPPRAEAPRDVSTAVETLNALNEPAARRIVRVWMGASEVTADKATVTLVWEAMADTPPPDEIDRIERVTVTATSIAGVELYRGPVARDPQVPRPSGFITFTAPPGHVQIRVVAENARGLRLDTDERAFEVPKPSPASPVVIAPAIYRGRTVRDIQQLRAAAAPLPTATRTFSRSERLLLRFQVIAPGEAPPAVTMKILNQGGGTMANLPPPTAGPNGRYEAEIALGGLPGGTYLIECAATAGGATTRSLVAIRVAG